MVSKDAWKPVARWVLRRRGRVTVVAVIWLLALAGWLLGSWIPFGVGALGLVTWSWTATLVMLREQRENEITIRGATGHLWGLLGLLTGRSVLPALEGPAMSLEGAHALASHVSDDRPATVVELGPGASTAVIHLAATAIGYAPAIFALEHDPRFASIARTSLGRLGIDEDSIVEAPLEPWTIGSDWSGRWYGHEGVSRLPTAIDLLVVDGPPNDEGEDSRYPALAILAERLRPGSFIYVDDTDRPVERRMVHDWQQQHPCAVVRAGETFTILTWRGHPPAEQ